MKNIYEVIKEDYYDLFLGNDFDYIKMFQN